MEYKTYYPHAQTQANTLSLYKLRLKSWIHSCSNLIIYFELLAKIEAESSIQYSKFSTISSSLFNNSNSLFTPLISYAKALEDETRVSANKITEFTVRDIKDFRLFLVERLKHYENLIKNLTATVVKSRKDSINNIHVHEKTGAKHLDPWLTSQILKNKLELTIEVENQYQSSIQEILEELHLIDIKIVSKWKSIYNEFGIIQTSKSKSIQKILIKALGDVESVMNDEQVIKFQSSIVESGFKTLQTLDSHPYKILDQKIILQGKFFRAGSIISSKYHPCYLVLTESGFLHCFKDVENLHSKLVNTRTIYTIDLSNPRTSVHPVPSKSSLFVFEICVQKSGSRNYQIKSANELEMNDWVSSIREVVALRSGEKKMPIIKSETISRKSDGIEVVEEGGNTKKSKFDGLERENTIGRSNGAFDGLERENTIATIGRSNTVVDHEGIYQGPDLSKRRFAVHESEIQEAA